MGLGERDPHSGHMTTGHEWNGIKELNTPVPWPVWFFLIGTALFSLGYWVLMPAWPTGVGFTRGLLGYDDREVVDGNVARASAERAVWLDRIAALDHEAIRADAGLMAKVREDGARLFGDNCAACHGTDATGTPGYPSLVDGDWLWGGSPEAIEQTIRVGINSVGHPETRVSQMMAFGRDGLIDADAALAVANYVKSLSDGQWAAKAPDEIAAGAAVFADNCAICHGPEGKGDQSFGAPDLTDAVSLHGSGIGAIHAIVVNGRQGEMPAWETRLSAAERKLLTVYLLDKAQAR